MSGYTYEDSFLDTTMGELLIEMKRVDNFPADKISLSALRSAMSFILENCDKDEQRDCLEICELYMARLREKVLN